jgi:hypothetical protein
LRSVEVTDLPAALEEIASLVVAAEAHWHTQPRNPASAKKAGGTPVRRTSTKQHTAEDQPREPENQTPDAEPVPAGQLPLFG